MNQDNARHGFILSDIELIAIKRFDRNGRLAGYQSYGEAEGSQLSVLLRLWYLGMPAAEDNHWALS